MTNAERFIGDEDLIDTFIDEIADHIVKKLDGYFDDDKDYIVEILKDFFKKNVAPTLTEDERVILRNIDKKYSQTISREMGNLELRGNYETTTEKVDTVTDFDEYNHLFQFIKERRRILY